MQTLQFDYHIGNNYSLSAIRTEYPLLKFIQISHLKCHVLCAVDSAINLHFIQFRDKLPSNPTIYPPSYALTGHPKILFTIEPLALLKEVKGKSLNEEEFTKFYSTTAITTDHEDLEISTIPIRPGVMFCKIVKRGRVYLLDFTKKDNKPQIMDSLIDPEALSMYDDNILLFSSNSLEKIFMFHIQTNKIRKLNFIERYSWILKAVPKRNLCIAVFNGIVEILDTKINNVIERFLFNRGTYHIITVSPDSSRIVHCYSGDIFSDRKMYMRILNVTEDSKIVKREPFLFDTTFENPHHIEFLNDNILIYARGFRIDLFKVEDTDIIKLYCFSTISDQGFIEKPKHICDEDIQHLSLTIVDAKNFLLITSDLHKDSSNSIESFEISAQTDSDDKDNSSQQEEIGKIRWHRSDNLSIDTSLTTILNIKAKYVFLEKIDSIEHICSWKNEKVGLLHYSGNFCEYNLFTGKLYKVMRIPRQSYGFLAKISYFDSDNLVLCYKKHPSKARLIIINLNCQTKILDTKELKLVLAKKALF